MQCRRFDLPQAIDNALTLVRERAGRRRIALYQAVDERLGVMRGDERKVKQGPLNLLSNALKFTPEGGRVEVRAGVVDGMVEVSVTDTGVGIAPDDQERRGAPRRSDLGQEPGGDGVDVHVHLLAMPLAVAAQQPD